MDTSMDTLILEFYRKNIILKGDFTLKNGEKADHYIDCRKLFNYPDLIKYLAIEFSNLMPPCDKIVGIPDGATPLATAISLEKSIPLLLIKKQQKNYGTQKQIEGVYKRDDSVVIIEDVVTTGSSIKTFSDILLNNKLIILDKYCIINRGNVKNIKSLIDYNKLINPENILIPKFDKRIIWAADVMTFEEIFTFLDKYGSKIGILKMHIDTFKNFTIENLLKLAEYKKKYNLLIWEDSKFADIAHIIKKKIKYSPFYYNEWVDIFSIHAIMGEDTIAALQDLPYKWILIGQLSTNNNLISKRYTEQCKNIYINHKNIVGLVCQEYYGPEYIHIVPGISNNIGDNMGQTYKTKDRVAFADFLVIGRSIHNFL